MHNAKRRADTFRIAKNRKSLYEVCSDHFHFIERGKVKNWFKSGYKWFRGMRDERSKRKEAKRKREVLKRGAEIDGEFRNIEEVDE